MTSPLGWGPGEEGLTGPLLVSAYLCLPSRRPVYTAVLGSSSILTTASWPLTSTSCPPLSSAASRTTRLPRPCQVLLQNNPETRHQAASHRLPQERRCLDGLLYEPWACRNLYRKIEPESWALLLLFLEPINRVFTLVDFLGRNLFMSTYWYQPLFCHLVPIFSPQPWQLRNCLL